MEKNITGVEWTIGQLSNDFEQWPDGLAKMLNNFLSFFVADDADKWFKFSSLVRLYFLRNL